MCEKASLCHFFRPWMKATNDKKEEMRQLDSDAQRMRVKVERKGDREITRNCVSRGVAATGCCVSCLIIKFIRLLIFGHITTYITNTV